MIPIYHSVQKLNLSDLHRVLHALWKISTAELSKIMAVIHKFTIIIIIYNKKFMIMTLSYKHDNVLVRYVMVFLTFNLSFGL